MAIKWHFYDDFRDIIAGRMGENPLLCLRPLELAIFVGGKLTFLTLAIGIPLFFHPFWVVATFYAITVGIVGVVLSVVFQLAHTVEEAAFPIPQAGTEHISTPWAVHQVAATVDFARRPTTRHGWSGASTSRSNLSSVPDALPRELSGHLGCGGERLPGVRCAVRGEPDLQRRRGLAFPLAAAHGSGG